MKTRYVVCEGPDDLGVLRALLNETNPPTKCSSPKHLGIDYTTAEVELHLVTAPGAKSGLARRVLDFVAEPSASKRPDIIGVVFDPDRDPPDRELGFFTREYDRLADVEGKGGPLQRDGRAFGVRSRSRDVSIRFEAWRSNPPTRFAGLPDDHCLERVLIGGILAATHETGIEPWARDSTAALVKLVSDHGWKRAFRIWNAALEPKAESFADRLLEAPGTRSACLDALRATPVAKLLEELLSD